MTELKPCPFCGSDDCQMLPFGDQVYVHCNDCGGESGFDLTAEKAAEKWNRRTKKSAQVSASQRESTQKKDGQKNKPVFKYKDFPGFGRT